ncbi:MAG: ribosomal protein [Pseudomonadota bacterium]|jgi:small subunit ribosomal protein S2
MSKDLPNFTIRQLIEAGVHFGHKSMRRNPKMSKYIFTTRNNVSIIDLNKTKDLLNQSLKIVKEIAKNNGRILFVATKKQASEPIAESAKRCGQYFVNFRWLGGMLTNWKTVSQSIKTLQKIEEQLADTEVGYNKKEKLVLQRERTKLEQNLGGIKNMGGYPDLVFVIDTNKESLAIAEARKLNIPIMAIVDTNCNPDNVNHIIPGNDDSAKSIKLYCRLISDAIIAGIKENMIASGIDISKFDNDSISASLNEFKKSESKKNDKKELENKDLEKKKLAVKKSDNEASDDESLESDKDNSKTVTAKKSEKKSSHKDDKKSSEKKEVKKEEVKVVTKKPTKKPTKK